MPFSRAEALAWLETEHPEAAAVVRETDGIGHEQAPVEQRYSYVALFEGLIRELEGRRRVRHPALGLLWLALGRFQAEVFQDEAARKSFERAISVTDRSAGRGGLLAAEAHERLGEHLARQPELEGARRAFERAVVLFEKNLGPEHDRVGEALWSLGAVRRAEWTLPAAIRDYERVQAIFTQTRGSDHSDLDLVVRSLEALRKELAEEG